MFRKRVNKRNTYQGTSHEEPGSLTLCTRTASVQYRIPAAIVQSMRLMTTRLEREQRLPSRISVVSALRQEGVTTTTMALATTLAHDTMRTVCIVDLNWWWPNTVLHEACTSKTGVVPLLQGHDNWEHALIHTQLPNLVLLPAGIPPAEKRPAIARSTELQQLLTNLSERVDHLILDIPAILTTSDAIPLASLGTAACVVVHQGISPRAIVNQAVEEISHIPMLGVVMNRTHFSTPSWLLPRIS